jgi:hypothetical protein
MSSRKKSVDKSANFEQFIEETSDYLPPSTIKEKSPQQNKQNNKQLNTEINTQTNKRKKKTYIGDLFDEPVAKEKIVNTTLQLPESLNGRLKEFCDRFSTSKNKVVITLVEALLEEKGF